jgi:hypothetical protein
LFGGRALKEPRRSQAKRGCARERDSSETSRDRRNKCAKRTPCDYAADVADSPTARNDQRECGGGSPKTLFNYNLINYNLIYNQLL